MIITKNGVCHLFSRRFVDLQSKKSGRLCFKRFLTKKKVWNENFYCTRVNLRLNPKFVLEVGKVLATKGLFIV